MTKSLTYLDGDATDPVKEPGLNFIVHGCNDLGKWGRGFVLALEKRYPEAKQKYLEWYAKKTDDFPFDHGEIQVVPVTGQDIAIVNMITQEGITGFYNPAPAKLWMINKGFSMLRCVCDVLNSQGVQCTLHMPKIGSGLGGLDWSDVEKTILRVFKDRDITIKVYIYE
jgi:O-acetyl-ADP-ribose deacetylase (regulator of RNase III)